MKTIVITGGSSGIGAELVKNYLDAGDRVVMLARTNPRALPDFIACDLADESQITAAVRTIAARYGKIDTLINNAGLGISGATELLPYGELRRVIEVDYFAAVSLTRQLLPYMREPGKIVNISSACALFALPFRGVYCAAKAALSMFSYSLRMELAGTGICVVCICPGDIKSGFTANRLKFSGTNSRYRDRVTRAAYKVDSREDKRMSVQRSGKKIYRICTKKKKAMYLVGAKYKALYFFSRVLPTNLFLKLTNKLFGGF